MLLSTWFLQQYLNKDVFINNLRELIISYGERRTASTNTLKKLRKKTYNTIKKKEVITSKSL